MRTSISLVPGLLLVIATLLVALVSCVWRLPRIRMQHAMRPKR
jgi:hypothetical protein